MSKELYELRVELTRLKTAVNGLEVIVKVLADKILGPENTPTNEGYPCEPNPAAGKPDRKP